MSEERESDADLTERYQRIKADHDERKAKMERMKLGPARTNKAKFIGCLFFNLLTVESEMRERGLLK